MSDGSEKAIKDTLGDLRKAASAPVPVEDIESVVLEMLATMDGDLSGLGMQFVSGLESVSDSIQQVKSELAELRPEEIQYLHIPNATDELDAVVLATERATNAIMENVEVIEAVAEGLDAEAADSLSLAVTQIYEACSFQDITGQRINKVIKALRAIETKVETLLEAVGHEVSAEKAAELEMLRQTASHEEHEDEDSALLSGPQLDGQGMSQDDIDKLLADFD